jgi:hypothetical protein
MRDTAKFGRYCGPGSCILLAVNGTVRTLGTMLPCRQARRNIFEALALLSNFDNTVTKSKRITQQIIVEKMTERIK